MQSPRAEAKIRRHVGGDELAELETDEATLDAMLGEASQPCSCAEFDDWSSLRTAGFPAYDVDPDEPPADHRTDAERDHDRARALAELIGDQGSLFPLRHFGPATTTLKELLDYTEQQEELTARFAEHGRKRRAYLERLIAAAGNDLSMVWQEACSRLPDVEMPDQLIGARPGEMAADRTTPVMV